ncbi:MAG: Bax inhibitor-1/YccA family protein [Ruminococcus sp.]|nr:Bax inhibitor-1/YccA family protein [Ruminococcus sp.]
MNRLQSDGAQAATKTKKMSILASNPVMRRLEKVDEHDEVNYATYGGILGKTIFFMVMTIAGIVLRFSLAGILAPEGASTITLNIKSFEFTMTTGEIIALIAAVILGIGFQLLAFFAKPTTPVTGALYCITQGYFISFLIFKVLSGYEYLGALALALTLLIVLIMAILYTTGVIKVNKKFRMVMLTLFIGAVSISLLTTIAYFIPFTRGIVQSITANLPLSIIVTVIFIIIAALFLVSDFAVIDMVVTQQYPKKYEWQAAFGLSFTILWLYLKVLDLLMTIFGGKSK